jgi:hypothetical protein
MHKFSIKIKSKNWLKSNPSLFQNNDWWNFEKVKSWKSYGNLLEIFWKSLEILGNPLEILGNPWKSFEIRADHTQIHHYNAWRLMIWPWSSSKTISRKKKNFHQCLNKILLRHVSVIRTHGASFLCIKTSFWIILKIFYFSFDCSLFVSIRRPNVYS